MLAVLAMVGLLACNVSAAAGGGLSPSFHIASYNLRLNLASDGPNAWPKRAEAVKALIRYHEFDVFGTQEGLPEQIDELARMDEFAHVGVGRDDGKRAGEHSAIFYRKARFEALSQGDFWLSQTPEVPSKGWDARCCNRLASWVQLRDRESQRRFYVFSVHFDHEGELARKESAQLLLRKVKEIAGTAPVFCLGDFNSTPETEQIQRMQAALRDAYLVSQSPPYGPLGTFNGFKIDAEMKARIDYVFVSAGISVLKYGVLSDSLSGRFPSDHHPLLLRVRLD
ncbi:endonuclease/exonuclease/phosphatase family protein [Paucibacter sp. DJ2R-2]|uniref:endonuclease/exonuclease/phosphatase family protein n=1 Tax=Paucibacter sp. DJ2R-2 TaxID=2893558 RepID=UPI0021E3D82A|nr:endonuclease/exonuclease/phosphatase family protein [Paucibacter sp. DJ2R-2]MCV2420485.1 endonuclease/exonuclease/phosphatase family protein [Paucibacter sp. DJ4R-1]MCV2439663.1 endonuclease/exonuclease/phosphatase family protein [Paucibacter sp. DJ2R-2]